MKTAVWISAISFAFLAQSFAGLSAPDAGARVQSREFAAEASDFLTREIAAHISAVEQLDPPQPVVLGVPTAGDFTWGSFMRAVAMVSALSGETNIAGRHIPSFLGRLGLIEARLGGKTFSQLGAAITLRQFGIDLSTNSVWQSLSPAEQNEWRELLNPERFYDVKTHRVINLPENYMGVAARVATYDYQMGVVADRAFASNVLHRAAGQFLEGALYADDYLPTGRYDRYSQEYARFIFDAAVNQQSDEVRAAVGPSLRAVIPTWWALVGPDGYGYPWGRTIGAMSYMDTMEMVGFLAQNPVFRPAPLEDLAAVYYAAWNSLQRDYDTNRHLLNMFGFGRGNYRYMTPARQWQQTTAFLAKAADSLKQLTDALQAEGVVSFPAEPDLPRVARFDQFRGGDRPAGAWLVRQGSLRFTVPITTGVRPGIADYLPAPHGLPGFAAPVEQLVPALVPYIELTDGRVIAATDCADEIHPADDGQSVRVIWNRWSLVSTAEGKAPAELGYGEIQQYVDPGLKSEVVWRIDGNAVVRHETLTVTRPMTIRRFTVVIPSTGESMTTPAQGSERVHRFTGPEGTLEVAISTVGLRLVETVQATGDSQRGKGARGHIPLLVTLDARNIPLRPGAPVSWNLRLEPRE
jgi:hypothetical protein